MLPGLRLLFFNLRLPRLTVTVLVILYNMESFYFFLNLLNITYLSYHATDASEVRRVINSAACGSDW